MIEGADEDPVGAPEDGGVYRGNPGKARLDPGPDREGILPARGGF